MNPYAVNGHIQRSSASPAGVSPFPLQRIYRATPLHSLQKAAGMNLYRGTEADAVAMPGAPRPILGLSAGWWVVLGCSLCMMVGGGLSFWALGIYVRPLEAEFGWSRAAISGATSVMFLVGGITGPFVGMAVDRWGVRWPIVLGAAFLCLVYLMLARLDSLWQFYALFGLMAFVRAWVNYIPFFWLVSRWFPDRMGAPVGIMGVGFSAAGLVFVPLVTWMVSSFGWRWSFALSGMMIVAVTVPIGLLLKAPPAAIAGKPSAALERPASEFTLRRALRTRAFWLLAVALGLFFMGLVSFMFHAVPFYLSRGFTEGQAAAWVGASAALATAIRFGLGYVVDRLDDLKKFAVASPIALACAMALLTQSTEPAAIVVFVLLWSFGTAGGPILESVLVTRTFGTASFGAILGALGVAETVGNIVGPLLGGAVYDATGAYTAALVFYAAAFLVAAGAFALGDYRRV